MNLGEIRNEVRGLVNEPEPVIPNGGFFKTDELNSKINVANFRVNATIARLDRKFHFLIPTTFQTLAPSIALPAGQKNYILPTDTRSLLRVEWLPNFTASAPGHAVQLRDLKFPRQEDYADGYQSSGHYPVIDSGEVGPPCGYLWRGNEIDIIPTPDAVYTIRLWIDQRNQPLINDTDVPSSPVDMHILIALDAAVLCLLRPMAPGGGDINKIRNDYNIRQMELISTYGVGQGDGQDANVIRGFMGV